MTPNPIDDPTLIAEIAPTGKLRAVINLGNAVLARRQPDSDEPAGVSVDLARAFARLLGLELELIPVKVAAEAVAPAWMTWEGMVSTRQEGAAGRVETRNRSVRTADSSP